MLHKIASWRKQTHTDNIHIHIKFTRMLTGGMRYSRVRARKSGGLPICTASKRPCGERTLLFRGVPWLHIRSARLTDETALPNRDARHKPWGKLQGRFTSNYTFFSVPGNQGRDIFFREIFLREIISRDSIGNFRKFAKPLEFLAFNAAFISYENRERRIWVWESQLALNAR